MSRRPPLPAPRPAHQYLNERQALGRCSLRNYPIDVGFSDDTTDTYYDYYEEGFRHSPLRESRHSDESGSTRLPYIEFDDESTKRYSRNGFSERSLKRPQKIVEKRSDLRRVYPNQEEKWDTRLYHEIQTPTENVQLEAPPPRRLPSRMSERPHSSLSSTATSAAAYGCGGKCRTFENVCYFFLQLVFTMGVLIGVSLCIAGVVLRKSAARNLQVLVYIGVMVALVSGALLFVQCNARRAARARRKAAQASKRAPIPMEVLRLRVNPAAQAAAGVADGRRRMQVPQVHREAHIPQTLPKRGYRTREERCAEVIEEQGIPWWRRKDLNDR